MGSRTLKDSFTATLTIQLSFSAFFYKAHNGVAAKPQPNTTMPLKKLTLKI